jgi:integrase
MQVITARHTDRSRYVPERRVAEAAAPEWRLQIETAVTTGLRQSELLCLQGCDVDWQSNRLRVRRSLREGRFYDVKSRHSRMD